MKFLVSVILTALIAFALGLYLPWWTIALASFVSSLIVVQRPLRAFLAGFIAVFILWAILCWGISAGNDHILAPKIALILPLGGSVAALIMVTATVGGLVAGFGALTASFLPAKRSV